MRDQSSVCMLPIIQSFDGFHTMALNMASNLKPIYYSQTISIPVIRSDNTLRSRSKQKCFIDRLCFVNSLYVSDTECANRCEPSIKRVFRCVQNKIRMSFDASNWRQTSRLTKQLDIDW